LGILPFFLENAEFGNKRKKNLPHPEAQVRGGGCQQQVDRVADLPFEEVAIQSKVAFEVADSSLSESLCLGQKLKGQEND